jgi:hypothetical protein
LAWEKRRKELDRKIEDRKIADRQGTASELIQELDRHGSCAISSKRFEGDEVMADVDPLSGSKLSVIQELTQMRFDKWPI